MRNRRSHHESIVQQHNIPREVAHLNAVDNAIQMVASFIDPHAATWIKGNSRVPLYEHNDLSRLPQH
ncbi:hypothetical protein [Corynebacterium diphtheriae]|nr:hypothetical protein [Corynebacterium diphtheriae]